MWQVADRLNQLGVQQGDKVAHIGYVAAAYWAHLTRVQIVAELFAEKEDFPAVENVERILSEDGSLKPEVVRAFADTGATAIVTKKVPPAVAKKGWQELGANYYAYMLPK